MSDYSPIIPPPELVEQWQKEWEALPRRYLQTCQFRYVATQSAQWGADMELEACCELTRDSDGYDAALGLRASRRPTSLKKQALEQLDGIATCFRAAHMGNLVCDKIRRAIEALND